MDKASEFADILLSIYPHTEFQIKARWNQEETSMARYFKC